MLNVTRHNAIATLALNDPHRRNALGLPMFDALDAAVAEAARDDDLDVVVLRGEGPAFCAGFDLAAGVEEPDLMRQFILRLSAVNRALRRLPQPVVASVHGAAIAGGCALLSACDFVVAAADAKFGYPVHRIGVSPAVTLPLLLPAVGDGAARELVVSGRVIDGREAHRLGLATHLADTDDDLTRVTGNLATRLAQHGRHAMRTTKAWLNELDGSLDDDRFDVSARDSASITADEEAVAMLRAFWERRRTRG